MKRKSSILLLTLLCSLTMVLSGCNELDYMIGEISGEFTGKNMQIETYDENSQLIDSIHGESVGMREDSKIEGLLNIQVGGKTMLHMGSSLIAYEDGLNNVFNTYVKKVDITNYDKSVPMLNRLVSDMKNSFNGSALVILIRSQSGQPLATFAGNSVSYFSTDVPKTTGLLVDGKKLVIYRCDYTIYNVGLLNGQNVKDKNITKQ